MSNGNTYGKYQLSLKKMDGEILINTCADNLEEFKQRVKDAQMVAEYLMDPEAAKKQPGAPASLDPPADKECLHVHVREISGTNKRGPWQGEVCKKCNMIRFFSTKEKKWGPWEASKDK